MTPDEFRVQLANATDDDLLNTTLRDDTVPYVFDPDPPSWTSFKNVLSEQLGLGDAPIRVIGSGRLGFSLAPDKHLKVFTDTSDIDVAVINETAFDGLWLQMLHAAYPRPPVQMVGSLAEVRNTAYAGFFTPLSIRLDARILGDKVLPVLQTRTRWFNTLKDAARLAPRRHEDISCRLYRTWAHAEFYHRHSLALLKAQLQENAQ